MIRARSFITVVIVVLKAVLEFPPVFRGTRPQNTGRLPVKTRGFSVDNVVNVVGRFGSISYYLKSVTGRAVSSGAHSNKVRVPYGL